MSDDRISNFVNETNRNLWHSTKPFHCVFNIIFLHSCAYFFFCLLFFFFFAVLFLYFSFVFGRKSCRIKKQQQLFGNTSKWNCSRAFSLTDCRKNRQLICCYSNEKVRRKQTSICSAQAAQARLNFAEYSFFLHSTDSINVLLKDEYFGCSLWAHTKIHDESC